MNMLSAISQTQDKYYIHIVPCEKLDKTVHWEFRIVITIGCKGWRGESRGGTDTVESQKE